MKRAIGIAIVLASLAAGIPPVAHAEPGDVPPRAPTLVNSLSVFVLPKTTYTVVCNDYGAIFYGAPATMTMFAYTLNDMRGRKITSSMSVRDGLNSEFISVGAAGQQVTQTIRPVRDDRQSGVTTHRITPKKAGILRVGLAAWGDFRYGSGYVICFARYLLAKRYPVTITPVLIHPSHARIAYASDFTGGAGAASGVAAAAVNQRYVRTTKGYTFSIFRPGDGAATVVDPKGRVRHDSLAGKKTSTFSEASKGKWTYTLDASLIQSRSPTLWMMELPG